MTVPDDAMLISECEEIEIEESYKKLIGTASVKFPRGTVIRKTVTVYNEEEAAANKTLTVGKDKAGVIKELRSTTSVASPDSFAVGQRIRIFLGYTEDPAIAALAKTSGTGKTVFNDKDTRENVYLAEKNMHIMFDGYITKISVETPIELQCENLASALKEITCPKVTIKSKSTVNDFLSENGKYKLLKGTGLKLHPDAEAQKYDLGAVKLVPDLTVADVLTEWAKYGLHCFVRTDNDGNPTIAIGRSYFSNAKKDSIVNAADQPSTVPEILFNYHVATNNLTATSTNKKFLAIEAEGVGSDGKFFHLTLLKNPKYVEGESSTSDKWRVVNESKLSKKAMKLGIRPLSKAKDKVSMDLYEKRPYHSRKVPITRDELYEEAIKYYESYNMNGIEGSLTLFGDLHLHTAWKVHLNDTRYPGKNGYYLIDEVNTTFGTGGYRQTIKLPYCIQRDKTEDTSNEQK